MLGILDIGPDEGQMASLVGGLGPAGKGPFLSRGQVLNVQVDRGATEALFQQGLNGPGHGSVHDGKQHPAVGLGRERPANLGAGGQDGLRPPFFGLFELYADGGVEDVPVELIPQVLR